MKFDLKVYLGIYLEGLRKYKKAMKPQVTLNLVFLNAF
jgi:hypothetical protein